jgi:hypothetical protein
LIRFALATVGVLLMTLSGCSSPAARQTYDVKTSHLRSLLSLRTQALSQGQLPKTEADFKRYINSLDVAMLDRIKTISGVSTIDELFVSERDGQSYIIFYGQPPAGVAADLVG